ncbi:MAG: hypothetical protein EBV24_09995 [Actinobacteria bacterium]|nr:hypothetical protein [Actinomycetota bacterium]
MGRENAEVILNSLNFSDVEQVASQADMSAVKTDVATLKTDVATLKTDVATLKTDMDFRFSLMMETLDKKFLNIKIWFLVTGAGIALAVVNLYKR